MDLLKDIKITKNLIKKAKTAEITIAIIKFPILISTFEFKKKFSNCCLLKAETELFSIILFFEVNY